MSQADFEKAKQRFLQAKQEILLAINVLNNTYENLSEYELTSAEVVQLKQEYQQNLEEIRKTLEKRRSGEAKRGVILSPKPHKGVSTRVVGEIPPFDDYDEEDDLGTSRGFSR